MGHSIGSSVIWSYWQLWRQDRLSKLIFVDQMPMITADPRWSAQEKEDAGAIFDPTSLYDTINQLAGPDGVKTTEGFIGGMFTKAYSRPEVSWGVQQNLKMPRQYAAALLYNHATQDWRRVIPHQPADSGGRGPGERRAVEVTGVDSETGPRLEDRDLRGERRRKHFMFMENPDKFIGSSGTSWADKALIAGRRRGEPPRRQARAGHEAGYPIHRPGGALRDHRCGSCL